jgi:hypothetical protein
MKRTILIFAILLMSISTFAQEMIYIHKTDNVTIGGIYSDKDSVYFNDHFSMIFLKINGYLDQYLVSEIDSITFGEPSDTVYIDFSDNTANVKNPYAFSGIKTTVKGADVTINSTTETRDINYMVSGNSGDGMLKIYSNKRYILSLNNLNLTNADGPAINIQSNNKVFVNLADGTTNSVSDGEVYSDPFINYEAGGITEDQKGAFFSEGQLIFNGNGTLTINGNASDRHALCSDDYIEINSGNIKISKALRDGIHGKQGVIINGGTVDVNSAGSGIDGDNGAITILDGNVTVNCSSADVNAISCDSTINILGGKINVTTSGLQSKAIKSDQVINILGGNLNVTIKGDAALETSGSGYDPAYCTALKCDSLINIEGGTIVINSSGTAGKGISAPEINMSNGNVEITSTGGGATYTNSAGEKDAYVSTCITSDGNINIGGGTLKINSSGGGGKGISADGSLIIGNTSGDPDVSITTTGSKITISSSSGGGGGWGGPGGQPGGQSSGDYAEAKAISCNGAVAINKGKVTISSADDGIKSENSITINNGTVTISKSTEGMESPNITINNGTVSITSSDDGFNATNGSGGESNDGSMLNLNGGNIYVNSSTGDGLDSNGSIKITGGTIAVHGPQSEPEVGMDCNGTCDVTGGLLVISGINSNMTEAMSTSSSQYGLKITSNSRINANTIFNIQDSDGNNLVTFKPVRNYSSIIFSSPSLQNGKSYTIYTGGNSTGSETSGFYSGGTYSGGTKKKSFSVSSKVTSVSF